MNGADFKYLAAVSNLANLDFDIATMSLLGTGKTLTATYQGNFSAGYRSMPDDTVLSSVLLAKQIKTVAGLLNDDAVTTLTATERATTIKSRGSQYRLIHMQEPPAEILEFGKSSMTAKISREALRDEILVAQDFAATSLLRPELTGLHVSLREGTVVLQTTDGTVAFTTSIPAKVSKRGDIIAPIRDFLLGLELMPSGPILIGKSSNQGKVMMHGPQAGFAGSLINGTWPDFSRAITRPEDVGAYLTLTSDQFRAFRAMGAMYGASHVTFTPASGKTIAVIQGESGRYRTALRGDVLSPATFNIEYLSKFSKLGDTVTLGLSKTPGKAAWGSSGDRHAWLMPVL